MPHCAGRNASTMRICIMCCSGLVVLTGGSGMSSGAMILGQPSSRAAAFISSGRRYGRGHCGHAFSDRSGPRTLWTVCRCLLVLTEEQQQEVVRWYLNGHF